MSKFRNVMVVLGVLLCTTAAADTQVRIGIGLPYMNIGVRLQSYPELVAVPGYPVYYAPRLNANYFFYDGMYWVYENDNWYASTWYNGPWSFVDPEAVPVFILRIPVGYYRRPPVYFHGWRPDEPPRWGDHWGREWQHHRNDWNKWDRHAVPAPAPLPMYQRQYSGDRYPRESQQQRELRHKDYRYQPQDDVVRQHYDRRSTQGGAAPNSKSPRGANEDDRGSHSRRD